MPDKARCHETDDGYEVFIREDLAAEYIATARVGGFGEGVVVPGMHFVRHGEAGEGARYVVVRYGDVRDPHGFRRFCRSWRAG